MTDMTLDQLLLQSCSVCQVPPTQTHLPRMCWLRVRISGSQLLSLCCRCLPRLWARWEGGRAGLVSVKRRNTAAGCVTHPHFAVQLCVSTHLTASCPKTVGPVQSKTEDTTLDAIVNDGWNAVLNDSAMQLAPIVDPFAYTAE